jgi:hypothetical protein
MRIHGIYSAASYARGRPNSDLGGDHTLGLATVYGFASFSTLATASIRRRRFLGAVLSPAWPGESRQEAKAFFLSTSHDPA